MYMDDEINRIGEDYCLDREEAESVQEIADSTGLDEDDAYMLYEEGIGPEDI